ncbi:putative RNA 2'-phosphotransferase, partial [Operophtera brumata]
PEKNLVERTLEDATRALASEIPRAPKAEDWVKFKQDTGIDINIDLNRRLPPCDPAKAIERLEQIERETLERFNRRDTHVSGPQYSSTNFVTIMNDFETWKLENLPTEDFPLFNDFNARQRSEFSDNSESRSDWESDFPSNQIRSGF